MLRSVHMDDYAAIKSATIYFSPQVVYLCRDIYSEDRLTGPGQPTILDMQDRLAIGYAVLEVISEVAKPVSSDEFERIVEQSCEQMGVPTKRKGNGRNTLKILDSLQEKYWSINVWEELPGIICIVLFRKCANGGHVSFADDFNAKVPKSASEVGDAIVSAINSSDWNTYKDPPSHT